LNVYAEDDFVFRIVLHTMTSKALVDFRVSTSQRFQDGNRLYRAGAPGRRF